MVLFSLIPKQQINNCYHFRGDGTCRSTGLLLVWERREVTTHDGLVTALRVRVCCPISHVRCRTVAEVAVGSLCTNTNDARMLQLAETCAVPDRNCLIIREDHHPESNQRRITEHVVTT